MDVHGFTVGPVAENCFFAARTGSDVAIVVDPGDEGERLIAALDELGLGPSTARRSRGTCWRTS